MTSLCLRRPPALLVPLVLVAVALAGCSTDPASGSAATGSVAHPLQVVAAENFWGSIAAQLGGPYVHVTSIITNPNTDPHDYEPTAGDGRAIAAADVVVVNGVGYDTWASKLVAADPDPHRTVLTVGTLVGAPVDGNPHRWYDPTDVHEVIAALTADFTRLDPRHAAAFTAQEKAYETSGLAAYDAAIQKIRSRFAGTPVGASESIFAMIAPALGLKLLTPPTFLRAISEGTDPTAADKSTIDRQIATRAIKVYVYNSQNATPDVQTQVAEAKAQGIPVTTITETMAPASATFQQWQTAQLVRLAAALAAATGR